MIKKKLIVAGEIMIILTAGVLCVERVETQKQMKVMQSEIEQMEQQNLDLNDELSSYKTSNQELTEKILEVNEKNRVLGAQLEEAQNSLEGARREIEELERRVVFNSSDVTVVSGTTTTHMKRALKDTGLYELSDTFVSIEENFGINAYFLAAVAAQESAWGTSPRAVNDNNLTGYAVYSSVSRGDVSSGKEENLIKTAELIKDRFLNPENAYYTGNSVYEINSRYCFNEEQTAPDYRWTDAVTSIASDLIDKANKE